MAGSLWCGLPLAALVRGSALGAAVVAVPVVATGAVVVGVAGAFPVGGEPVERGAGLPPVAAPAGFAAAGLGAEQRLGGRRAPLAGGGVGVGGPLPAGVAPARPAPPRLPGRAGLVGLVTRRPVVGGDPLGGRPPALAGRARRSLPPRPGA